MYTPSSSASVPGAAHKKSIIEVAASILSIAYYLPCNQVLYRDLGALYFTRVELGGPCSAYPAE